MCVISSQYQLSDIDVKVNTLDTMQALKTTWLNVQMRSHPNAFLSWAWIESLCAIQPSQYLILTAECDSKVVGIGIVFIKHIVLLKTFKIKQAYLHRYGQQELDQVWVEYNDFMVEKNASPIIKEAMLNYVFEHKLADEFMIGMSSEQALQPYSLVHANVRCIMESPGYQANLEHCDSLNDYFKTLSRNTRSQINRTRKLLEKEGQIHLTEALSVSQKHAYLKEISEIHKQRWNDSTYGSGFSNHHFVDFHQRLNNDRSEQSVTKIFELKLDTKILGFVYLLVQEDKWLFYLSALNYHPDKRVKIGLLFHSLVIEKAISEGIKHYDFLAGEARYKQSMSNTELYIQKIVCFYSDRFILRFMQRLRKSKLWINMHIISRIFPKKMMSP
jgi:hypothetical protein